MANLNLTINSNISDVEGKLKGIETKKWKTNLNINIVGDEKLTQIKNDLISIEQTAKQAADAMSNINSLGGKAGSSGKNGKNGIGNITNQYKKAFAESEKMYKSLERQKKNLQSMLDGGGKKALNSDQTKEITSAIKTIEDEQIKHQQSMKDYVDKTGDLSEKAMKNHAKIMESSQKALNQGTLRENDYKGVIDNYKKQQKEAEKYEKLQTSLSKSLVDAETSINKKSSNWGTFLKKHADIDSAELQQLTTQMQAYQAEYDKLAARSTELRGKMTAGTTSHAEIDEANALKTSMQNLGSEMNKVQQQAEAVIKPIREVENKGIAFDKLGNRLTEYFNKYESQLKKNTALYSKWQELVNKTTSGDFASVAEANRAFAAFRTECRAAGIEVESLGTKLSKTFGTRIRSALAGYGVMAMQTAVTDILQNVKEFDTAYTELKKVTNATSAEYAQFVEDAKARSIELKTSLTDVVSSAADFSRLGYDIPQAEELSRAAIVYSRVGDDVDSIDQASSSLISTMQAFQTPASDVMEIVDKFNEVGNNFATSSGAVGEGLMRSAAALQAAGNDIDQSIGLFTAAQTVTQDADVVGR